jgi:hypothetical protein
VCVLCSGSVCSRPTAPRSRALVKLFEGQPVQARESVLCKADGKFWSHYQENATTKAFMDELSRSLGMPRDLLSQSITTGQNHERGTWIHPRVAIHLGQWISPDFAVAVSGWVRELLVTGKVVLREFP